jgi:hypothetical protein
MNIIWPLSGPYSGICVKGSAQTVKVLERLNGFEGRESFADSVIQLQSCLKNSHSNTGNIND